MIKRISGKYWLKSKSGRHLGGPYDTKQEAEARIEQIEKHVRLSKEAKKLKEKYKK